MNWYGRLLASYPYLVVALVALVTGTCVTLVFTTDSLPDFSDPLLGFETRGTVLSQRLSAWQNLRKAVQHSGPLTANPSDDPDSPHFTYFRSAQQQQQQQPELAPVVGEPEEETERQRWEPEEESEGQRWEAGKEPEGQRWEAEESEAERWETEEWRELTELQQTGRLVPEDQRLHRAETAPPRDRWFCGPLVPEYGRAVFSSAAAGNGSLFQLEAVLSMCRLEEERLRAVPEFRRHCQQDHLTGHCCRSWSLGNYIALLHNRSSCHLVGPADVSATLQLLVQCSRYYHSQQLQPDCHQRPCRGVPAHCARHDAVYHLMHYILDVQFLPPQRPDSTRLRHAVTYLPLARSQAILPYFTSLPLPVRDNVTAVVALELGLKSALFDQYLLADSVYLGAAAGIILVCMWLYTGSLLITLATLLAVLLSLAMAYFFYSVVFQLPFFPFMNLLAAVIAVGVGADDTFIFCKVWERCKSDKNAGTLAKLVGNSLRQAALSMLVTSLTTAAAFFSSYVSHVTAIASFSLFAGMTILVNFVLMVTWTPGFVVMRERFCHVCPPVQPAGTATYIRQPCALLRRCFDLGRVLFDKLLPCVVVKLRWPLVVLLGGLAAAAAVVVCYHPRLRLPESQQFQLFSAQHPFERYDAEFADQFWFERGGQSETNQRLPLWFVWGVLPRDNGDFLNPADRGTLVLDRHFNMASPAAQRWLFDFCRDLRNQSFYQSTQGPLLPNCFIETLKSWMEERRCHDDVTGTDRSPCCETTPFPYQEAVFNQCLIEAIHILYNTPAEFFMPGIAGPKFLKNSSRVAAVVVEYDSNFTFSLSHKEMGRFYDTVEGWMQGRLRSAPPGMRTGWFISYTEFYDLQTALADGTLLAIGVAVALALLVLIVTTLEVRISLFAGLTIACVIFVTCAALVLLGWRLNVLEAVAVTVAIGLSVDFTLHYSVAYRLGEQQMDREARVVNAITTMGSPIAMAAVTTLTAGLCMLPSSVLAYVQIGIFLVLLTATSWCYATLFFLPLLRLWGPERACRPAVCRREPQRPDKTVYNYTISESTLSTSSNTYLHPGGDLYELESLTPRQRHRSWRGGGEGQRQRSASVGDTHAPAPRPLTPRPRKKSLPALQVELAGRQWAAEGGATGSVTTVVLCEDSSEVEPNRCPGVPDVWVRRS